MSSEIERTKLAFLASIGGIGTWLVFTGFIEAVPMLSTASPIWKIIAGIGAIYLTIKLGIGKKDRC